MSDHGHWVPPLQAAGYSANASSSTTLSSECCVCELQCTPEWNATCGQCRRLCHFGEACSTSLSGGRTICLKCAVEMAAVGLGVSTHTATTSAPVATAMSTTSPPPAPTEPEPVRGILRAPTTTFSQLPSPPATGQPKKSASITSIIAGAASATAVKPPKRKPGELPKLLKVQDPCNDRQNPRLTVASRIKCLHKLHRLLIENDQQLDAVSDEDIPLAAHCELKIFKRHVLPGQYYRQITSLFKSIEAATKKGEIYDIHTFMEGSGRASVTGPASKRRRVEPDSVSTAPPSTAPIEGTSTKMVATAETCDSQGAVAAAKAPAALPTSVDATMSPAESPPTSSASDALAFLEVECGCRVAIVDTSNKLETVLDLFSVSGAPVAVDIEGANLGATGKIATVQLCVQGSNDVFICDIVSLGTMAFATSRPSLRGLLESDDVLKIFWDCRTDSAALYHQYGVRPRNVLDLQVMHLALLVAANQRPEFLTGLGKVLDRYCPIPFEEKARLELVKKEAHKLFAVDLGGSVDAWLNRPLPHILLEYATDVRYFHPLRGSLNRCRNGKVAGVEILFQNVLGEVCDKRVSDSCSVATATKDSGDRSGAHAEPHIIEKLCDHIAKFPDGPRKDSSASTQVPAASTSATKVSSLIPERKAKIASLVKRLLQQHYNDRRLTKEQFKVGAKKLTAQLFQVEMAVTDEALDQRAHSLVRCYLADIDPTII